MRRLGALAMSVALALAAGRAEALPEHAWLVAIGNNTGEAGEVPLRYAESDARAFADTLRQLGGLSGDRIRLLLDGDADAVARAIEQVEQDIGRVPAGTPTALVVYYSGHADATALHLGGTRLGFETLRGMVSGGRSTLRLLIVDACRSGGVSRVKGGGAVAEFAIGPSTTHMPEGFAVLTSSAAGEASQESDRLGASFFSHHLLGGLRGAADRDRDARVTLTEAYDYAYSQTVRASGRTLERQHPTYAFDFKGRAGLVLSRLDRPTKRIGGLTLREASVYVVRRAHAGGPIVAEVAPPDDGAELFLPAGRYFVQQRLPRLFREFVVELGAGDSVDLAVAPFSAVEYDRLVRRRGAPQRSIHGLMALGGARGEVVPGEGVVPQAVIGYRLDLPWFTTGVRVRGSTVTTVADGGLATRTHDELGVALTLERFTDLRAVSAGFGLLTEVTWGRQRFDTPRDTPDRRGMEGAFGGVLSLERHLGAGLGLRLEGGPLAAVARRAEVEDGVQIGAEVGAELVWWAAAGLTWRL